MKEALAVLLVFITNVSFAFAEITPVEERDIARWIIRKGGQVMVTGVSHPIGDPFELPSGDFRIVVVDMHGTITEPKQLEPLSKLTHVRELVCARACLESGERCEGAVRRRVLPVLPGHERAGEVSCRV